ncbi:MAG: dihydropyrimidinase [Eubacterium sp.]
MKNKTLIQGGTLITSDLSIPSDLLIENGKISRIGKNLSNPDAQIIDASGKYIFAGFIDPHTHLDLTTSTRTADNFETGTRAALAGGTTTIIDFATQEHDQTLKEALTHWHKLSDGCCSCHYAFHMAISDWNKAVRAEIAEMIDNGIISFKLYMAYDAMRTSDYDIYEVLKEVKKYNGLVAMHCENGDLVNALTLDQKKAGHLSPAAHPLSRPDYAEAEAISRYLYIAEAAGAPAYIVHLSSKAGLEECMRGRLRGQQVAIETCPQYLVLDDSCYNLPDFESAKYVFAPPARKKEDQDALWGALFNNTIDTIGSDHCSFTLKAKALGRDDFSVIPNGIPGVEHRPILYYTLGVCGQGLTLNQMAAQLSENAAKIYGLYPQKGALLEGSDADIVIWNPDTEGVISAKTHHQRVDYTPYEGISTKGSPETVLLGGEIAVFNGKIILNNAGRYVKRGICRTL